VLGLVIETITRILPGNSTELCKESITELATGTTTEISTGTTGSIDTIIIIRTTCIPITDLTTDHIITVMVTTLTLGFTFLPTEAGSILDWAFEPAQEVRMVVAPDFSFCRQEVNYGSLKL